MRAGLTHCDTASGQLQTGDLYRAQAMTRYSYKGAPYREKGTEVAHTQTKGGQSVLHLLQVAPFVTWNPPRQRSSGSTGTARLRAISYEHSQGSESTPLA
jgi:hypothetical protein